MGLSASVDITVKARFAFDGGTGSSKGYVDLLAGRHWQFRQQLVVTDFGPREHVPWKTT